MTSQRYRANRPAKAGLSNRAAKAAIPKSSKSGGNLSNFRQRSATERSKGKERGKPAGHHNRKRGAGSVTSKEFVKAKSKKKLNKPVARAASVAASKPGRGSGQNARDARKAERSLALFLLALGVSAKVASAQKSSDLSGVEALKVSPLVFEVSVSDGELSFGYEYNAAKYNIDIANYSSGLFLSSNMSIKDSYGNDVSRDKSEAIFKSLTKLANDNMKGVTRKTEGSAYGGGGEFKVNRGVSRGLKVSPEDPASNVASDTSGKIIFERALKEGVLGDLEKVLKDRPVIIHEAFPNGLFPIHIASENGNEDAVRFLLENGANPSMLSNLGDHPLDIAAHNGHDKIVKLLLGHGAETNLKRVSDGKTAAEVARNLGKDRIADMIDAKSALVSSIFHKISTSSGSIADDFADLAFMPGRKEYHDFEFMIDSAPVLYEKQPYRVNYKGGSNDAQLYEASLALGLQKLGDEDINPPQSITLPLPVNIVTRGSNIYPPFKIISPDLKVASRVVSVRKVNPLTKVLEVSKEKIIKDAVGGDDVSENYFRSINRLEAFGVGDLARHNTFQNSQLKYVFPDLDTLRTPQVESLGFLFNNLTCRNTSDLSEVCVEGLSYLKFFVNDMAILIDSEWWKRAKSIKLGILAQDEWERQDHEKGFLEVESDIRKLSATIPIIKKAIDALNRYSENHHDQKLKFDYIKSFHENLDRMLEGLSLNKQQENIYCAVEGYHLERDEGGNEVLLATVRDISAGGKSRYFKHLKEVYAKSEYADTPLRFKDSNERIMFLPFDCLPKYLQGDMKIIGDLTKEQKDLMAKGLRHTEQVQALYDACLMKGADSVAAIKAFFDKGVSVDTVFENGATSLHIASQRGDVELMEFLLNKGSDPSITFKGEGNALNLATENNHTAVVKLLLGRSSVDVDQKNDRGEAPRDVAIKNGFKEIEELILKSDLLHACLREGIAFIRKILKNDSKYANAVLDDWSTVPIHLASKAGDLTIVKELLKFGADPSLIDRDGMNSLHYAAEIGDEKIVKLLLDHGVRTDQKRDGDGKTAAELARDQFKFYDDNFSADDAEEARRSSALKNIVYMIDAQITEHNVDKINLIDACAEGKIDIVRRVIEIKPDAVNAAFSNGAFPIHSASENGKEDVVTFLLENGADPSVTFEGGETPLYFAAQNGHIEVVKELLKRADVDINQPANDNVTPLFKAYEFRRMDMVELFLQRGADCNIARKSDGTSIFHIVCETGNEHMVKLLLEHNCNASDTMNNGVDGLFMAAQNGHEKIVKLLLDHGVKTDQKRDDGETALDMARHWGYHNVVKMIEAVKKSKEKPSERLIYIRGRPVPAVITEHEGAEL